MDEGSGSKLKLKTWAQRHSKSMGYEAPGGKPIPLIDRVHRLMHLWRAGDVHKVDEYIDDSGLRRHELFKRLLQMNRDLVHGAFVLDENSEYILFRDTLQLENLDRNELEATIHSLSLALAEYSQELLDYAKK